MFVGNFFLAVLISPNVGTEKVTSCIHSGIKCFYACVMMDHRTQLDKAAVKNEGSKKWGGGWCGNSRETSKHQGQETRFGIGDSSLVTSEAE